MGPFKSMPAPIVHDEFREWVRNSGRPDQWVYHEASQPPRGSDFEQLLEFSIPEKLRPDVGRASCPICSPHSPKYFDGALAWFPTEGVLRAIGIECAKSHFGASRYNEARARRLAREARVRDENYLLAFLPSIDTHAAKASSLLPVAIDVDSCRELFRTRLGKENCERLARRCRQGALRIEETREIESAAVDRFGNVQKSWVTDLIREFVVSDADFLTTRYLVENLAKGTLSALERLPSGDEEAALQFVARELDTDQKVYEAAEIARRADESLTNLQRAIDQAKRFLSPGNLSALSEWSSDRRSGSGFAVGFDAKHGHLVRFAKKGHKPQEIRLPDSLVGEPAA